MKNGKCINDRIEVSEAFLKYAKRINDGIPSVFVSMETMDGDFDNAYKAIESLLAQTIKPKKILVNIPVRDIVKAPDKFLKLCEKSSIEIRPIINDMGALNVIQETGSILLIINGKGTYEPEMISKLLMWQQINPSAVISTKSRRPVFSDDDKLVSFALWPVFRGHDGATLDMLVPADDSVILVPPYFLSDIFRLYDPEQFQEEIGLYIAMICKERKTDIMCVHIDMDVQAPSYTEEIIDRKDDIIRDHFLN